MSGTIKQSKRLLAIILVSIMLIGVFSPFIQAEEIRQTKGFDRGLSYTSVIPIKKTTFVNFDEETLTDDYAYLAAVPTAVYNHENTLYSHPLLFYQDKLKIEDDNELVLDAFTGIDYFMEDWTAYCGQLDQMTLINVDQSKVSQWRAKEYITIEDDDPYKIAKELALQDWEYSDDAVVAVINDEFKIPDNEVNDEVTGTLPASKIKKERLFTVKQTNTLNPVSEYFSIGEGFKQLYVECWWDGAIVGGKMMPAGDPDFQISFKNGDDWMYANVASDWNINEPVGREFKQSYIYQPGDWRITITDYPTKGNVDRRGIPGLFEVQGALLGLFKKQVTYYLDVYQYPGIDVVIPDIPSFGVEDAEFKLTWNNPNVKLGFTLIGPSGEVICSEFNQSREDNQELYVKRLGECLEDEHYSVSVYSKKNIDTPLDFKIEYSWRQVVAEEKADALTSATEGAVLASSLNAPLLYVKPNEVLSEVKDVLYQLGVSNVHFVDIGNHATDGVEKEISDIVDTINEYKTCREIYDEIREISGSDDVVFSTIDPWTPWGLIEMKPLKDKEGALYIGPAAYTAAHHGSPVIIVEKHPRLSSALTWYNEFWRRFSKMRMLNKPSVAEMVFTGTKVYDFLKDYNFDKEGKESITTVAGQFEIGIPWDRMFVGVANSGRICGSPIDSNVWISRSVFYPALIFVNPALQGKVEMESGSTSERQGFIGLLKEPRLTSLVITKKSRKEEFDFPIMCSFVGLVHRFNERASKFYGSQYQCADGLIPGETTTMEPIDEGSIKKYTGMDGMYFPDMTNSEIIPFYLEKGGYDPVYATRLEVVIDNLNQGTLLWIHLSHGNQARGGQTLFWDPQAGFKQSPLVKRAEIFKKLTGAYNEYNPWRGYDWLLGSTDEPDTMSMDIKGMIPFTNIELRLMPAYGMDWALARKPLRERLVEIPILGKFFSRIFTVDDLYDGITGSLSYSKDNLKWKNYEEVEKDLENLHSAGFITGICQTSNTYLHLMLIRHGSVYQIMDPWPTSWYGAVWEQSIPRDIILGDTVGEAYAKGISHVGTLYLGGGQDGGPQWWWDDSENVLYFGDPELRMYVPENEYSDKNTWDKPKALLYDEEMNINGHTPFGATNYPNAKEQLTFMQRYLWLIGILVLIVILLIVMIALGRKKKNR